jgi:hypothetical protein
MSSCCAVIGSVTYALKGQRLLDAYNVYCKVTKVRSAGTSGGCAYGLEYECMNTDTVTALLRRGGVQIKDIIRL